MAFGFEESFNPDLLRILQVCVTGFTLGIIVVAIHKTIKKYKLDD